MTGAKIIDAGREPELCEKCNGRRYILVPEGAAPCTKCHEEEFLRDRLRRSEVPRRYINCRLSNYEPNGKAQLTAVKCCEESIQDGRRTGLLLVGAPGTGKTHLAVATLSEHIRRRNYGLFLSAPQFIENLHREMRGEVDGNGVMEHAQLVDILLLDDLGAERVTDYTRDQLHLLLDHRYANELPVIVTSNKDQPEDLQTHLGERLYSRLAEMCRVVTIVGADYRLRKVNAS